MDGDRASSLFVLPLILYWGSVAERINQIPYLLSFVRFNRLDELQYQELLEYIHNPELYKMLSMNLPFIKNNQDTPVSKSTMRLKEIYEKLISSTADVEYRWIK
jgi:hypothetical protein